MICSPIQHDNLTIFLVQLRLITPAAARYYIQQRPKSDISYYLFRYAHNMDPL